MNRARRYILRVTAEGALLVTLPRWGSKREAHSFAQRETSWIEKQFEKRRTQTVQPWADGTTFIFRGELVQIQVDPLVVAFQQGDSSSRSDSITVMRAGATVTRMASSVVSR